MAKVLLLDFEESQKDYLASQNYDVELRSTGRRSGKSTALDLPRDSDILFYELAEKPEDGQDGVLAGFRDEVARRVPEGLRVVCFIGGAGMGPLANVIGTVPGLDLRDDSRAESIVFNPRALFHVPFERFRPFLASAYKLLHKPAPEGVWEEAAGQEGAVEILAKSADGYPVSLLIKRGKGYLLLLPSFGSKNIEIADYILKDKLPLAGEAKDSGTEWMDQDEFLFPETKALLVRRDEENARHAAALAEIERQMGEMKAGGPEDFLRLLRAEEDDLKKAVVHALRYLGWGKVVDVDDYWKKVIRNKEEDIWLIDTQSASVEASLRKESLILVLVRGNKAWATDDECALLQKYKGRRMQEFDNTKMKAVLIGNYFSTVDPRTRKVPFSAVQIEEGTKDGNGLLTTYELFKAIKAEKEGRTTREAIRGQLRDKSGLISFEF
jgi:hypothetical protein